MVSLVPNLQTRKDFKVKEHNKVMEERTPTKMRSIAILGVGSLGGYVAEELANINSTCELILVDYDEVEKKNIENSIYRPIDVGAYKVEALEEIIESRHGHEVTIKTFNDKFIEGKTILPKCDTVIDCRDFTYDRASEVDIRLYMSGRYLVIDCQKDTKYSKKHGGNYIYKLSKHEVRTAAQLFASFIAKARVDGTLAELLKHKSVHKIDIDYAYKETQRDISESRNSPDVILDDEVSIKFPNFKQKFSPIVEANKISPITICIGHCELSKFKNEYKIGELKDINDVYSKLSGLVNEFKFVYNDYVISLNKINEMVYVELLPHTAGA